MTDVSNSVGGSERADQLAIVERLWSEYQYRHDLVWSLIFRVTTVAVALIVAPFLVDESVHQVVGYWFLVLPGIAVFMILLGLFAVRCELVLLDRVRLAYRYAQNTAFGDLQPYWRPHVLAEVDAPNPKHAWFRLLAGSSDDNFTERVTWFLRLLLSAALLYFVLFAALWLPDLSS
jgi:hypothetical protein